MTSPVRVVTQVALLASQRLRGELAQHVDGGGLLAYPTATSYGFGGAVTTDALASLNALKVRDPDKPFLLMVRGPEDTSSLRWTDDARALSEHFWPGPLTLVLSDPEEQFPEGVRGSEGGVAVRRTAHLGALAVLSAATTPLTSSSANRPGERPSESGVEAVELIHRLDGKDVWVVDGGRLPSSPPSTIVDCTGTQARVLREGAIPAAAIAGVMPGEPRDTGEPREGEPREGEPREGEAPAQNSWSRPTRVLFVCTGNTCRSPMAEAIARGRLLQLGWSHVEVSSGGVWASDGQPASPEAVQVVERHGLDLAAHRSSALTPDRLLRSDLILTMGPGHLEALLESEAGARASTLTAFADGREDPFDGVPVPDPIGMGLDVYEATFRRVEEAIGMAFARLAPMLERR